MRLSSHYQLHGRADSNHNKNRYIDSAVSTQAVQREIEHVEIAELPAEGDVGVLIAQRVRKHEIDVAIREPAVRTETHAAEFGEIQRRFAFSQGGTAPRGSRV